MNSKRRTVLGVILLLIVLSVAAFYIASDISGTGNTDEEESSLADVQKNYLSPVSVSGLSIDKVEALADAAALLETLPSVTVSVGIEAALKNITTQTDAIKLSIENGISALLEGLGYSEKNGLQEAAKERLATITENHDAYEEEIYQLELEGTIHHLFDTIFVTNDALIDEYLNVRDTPGGNIIGRMYASTGGTFEDIQDGWVLIRSGDVVGWVSQEYILTGFDALYSGTEVSVVVDAELLVLRHETSTSSLVVDILPEGTETTFVDYTAGWVQVTYGYYAGYFKAEYVHIKLGTNTAVAVETVATETASQETEAAATQAEETTVEQNTVEETTSTETVELTADEQARQRIDAIYAEGRSSVSPIYLSADEVYLLASVIMMEAGSESYEGKLAVAGVVLNRLRNGYWGSTLSEVVYAPRQFTGAGTGLLDQIMASGPSEECIQAAYEACAGVHNIGSYLYFCSVNSAEYDQYSSYVVIGGQCFYAR